MSFNRVRAACLTSACLLPTLSHAAPFDLVYAFDGPITPAAQEALDTSEAFLERIVLGYQDGAAIDSLIVDLTVEEVDGLGGTAAFAAPFEDGLVSRGGFVLPTTGFIVFDGADVDEILDEGSAVDFVVHETLHAMGFGTLWIENGLSVEGSGRYTGARGVAAYRSDSGDPDAAFVPVTRGDEGVEGGLDNVGHWPEDWLGDADDPDSFGEVATPVVDAPTYLSNTTLGALEDLGYRTVLSAPAPVPLPASVWLLLGGVAAVGAAARRRRAG